MKCEKGMTLIEVLIAVALFATFVVSFMAVQSDNISDSIQFKGDLLLKDLALMKMNETIVNPESDFRPSAGKVTIEQPKEWKKFEEYPEYSFAIQFYKVFIPELSKITGQEEGENNPDQNQSVRQRIFDEFKRNMEVLVWQIRVVVRHEASKETYELSTWFYNQGGRVQFGI